MLTFEYLKCEHSPVSTLKSITATWSSNIYKMGDQHLLEVIMYLILKHYADM